MTSYDTWKTTEPQPQDGLQQCPQCGKLTDALYAMRFENGQWKEVQGHLAESVPDSERFCYRCCDELEGPEPE